MTAAILLTGVTGTIGRFLAARLTAAGHRVHGLVRNAAARRAEISHWIDAHGGSSARLLLVEGDLAKDGLGLAPADRAAIGEAELVFHLGAAVAWGLPRATAHEVNVRGTERLLALATQMRRLRRFVMVSGYGVALAPAEGPVRGGAYEATKVEADRRTCAFAHEQGLPLTRVHPCALIGDSETGETLSRFGFGDLVSRISRGALLAIPGGPRHWMPLVTVDYVANFLSRIPWTDSQPTTEYYLVDATTPALAPLVQTVARQACARVPRHRIPMAIARLVAYATRDSAMIEGLHFITEARFDTRAADLAAAAHGLAKPDIRHAIERSVAWLLREGDARSSRFVAKREAWPGGA